MKVIVLSSSKKVDALEFKQGLRVANPVYAQTIEAVSEGNGAKFGVLFDCEGKKASAVRGNLMKAARKAGVNIAMRTTSDESQILVTKLAGKPAPASKRTGATSRRTAPASVEVDEDEEDDDTDEETEDEDEE